MSEAAPAYTIVGGEADADRLARQAEVMDANSRAFLERVGVGPGWRCLDVGCGTGPVTIDMARMAGPVGTAVGIDVDDGALKIARKTAADAGVEAEFFHLDSAQHAQRGPYDLAYARLLLSHLPDPAATAAAMLADLKPGGTVAVEDLKSDTLRAEPPAKALDWLRDVYIKTVRAAGGDPLIGPRLGTLLRDAGCQDAEQKVVVNPMKTVEEKLFLAELVPNMREAILAAGAATPAEIDELHDAVAAAARDEDRTFFQTEIYQVAGRRPG